MYRDNADIALLSIFINHPAVYATNAIILNTQPSLMGYETKCLNQRMVFGPVIIRISGPNIQCLMGNLSSVAVRLQKRRLNLSITVVMTDVGQVVTLNMRNGKCIQGRIKYVDVDERIVLVERPFLNGKPMGGYERKFPISSILSFRVLDIETETRDSKVTSERAIIKSMCTPDVAVTAKEIKARPIEHSMNAQKSTTVFHSTCEYPRKTTKHSEVVHRSNFEKETIEATTSAHKNSAKTDTVIVPNAPLHANQQQQSPYSSHSGSSCSSPITKSLAKLDRGRRSHIAGGKFFPANSGEPKSLPCVVGPPHKGRRSRGHTGIPESDAVGQNNRDKKTNEDLIKPIDFDLNEDFDFEKNLEIFKNYEKNAISEQREISAMGTQFAQKNYEHFENIISDPSRVTSWTTKTHDQFVAARFEKTMDGQRIPFLKFCDKEKFLQRAEPYLGSDMFHVMIADRLMMFIWSIIDKFEIMVSQMVVLDSAAVNTFLTTMFLRHVSNRACQTIVYSCLLGQYNLPHVLQVHNVQQLPKHDVQLVVVLGPLLLGSVKEWIKNLWPSVHLVCIEKAPELIKNEHVLMVGVGTDNDESLKQKNSGSLRGVADVGIPFAWMDVDSAACLSRAFATQNILLC
uniref:ULP_PROTEASE domain-containing protein n=1 Tax=Elaeophora elaphi TaxID=1147741 RepID=A0A0R3RKB1_9BILA